MEDDMEDVEEEYQGNIKKGEPLPQIEWFITLQSDYNKEARYQNPIHSGWAPLDPEVQKLLNSEF